VGKTVLLREFGQIAKEHGWKHEHVEAVEESTLVEEMADMIRRALLRISAGRRLADRTRRAFGILKSFRARWKLPDGGELILEADPVPGWADSGRLDKDLADLFTELGNVASDHGTGVLFTIDELQYLSKSDLAALIVGLHMMSQLRHQLPLMVAGAGLPSLPDLTGQAKSFSERLFDFRRINSLDQGEAAAALSKPAEEQGVRWQPEALDVAVDITRGYPYFVQGIGKHSWEYAPGPDRITSEDVRTAVPIALDELDSGFFAVRMGRTTESERSYLRAMAALGDGPYRSGAVAEGMGKTTSQVSQLRDSLIEKGLCFSSGHNVIDFTVPIFDDYIRRRGI